MRTLPNRNEANTVEMMGLLNPRVRGAVTSFIDLYSEVKWKSVEFVIPLIPEPSHRPRLCGHRVYVPGAAKNQRFFQKKVLPKLNGLFIDTPCRVDVDIYVKTPTSFSKAQKVLAEMKILRPWVNTGDVDNYLKAVLDCVQPNEKRHHTGIMSNDCLVISSLAEKYYSIEPRYEVRITYMDKVPDDIRKVLRLENT